MKKNTTAQTAKHSATAVARVRRLKNVRLGEHILSLTQNGQENSIQISNIKNQRSIRITLTPEGPVLDCGSAVTLKCAGAFQLDADEVNIHGRQGVHLSSGQQLSLTTAGHLICTAATQTIRAERGDVSVIASDDVGLKGERIRLNC